MAKARRLPKAKGVSRIDDPGRHGVGWYARVTFRGKTVSKYFADAKHGGTLDAFDLAVAWRDATEKKVGKPRTDRLFPATSSRSRTGIPGVYKARQSYVVAWSPEPGGLRREFISITQYGAEEAFRRAVQLRRKRERGLYGRAVSHIDQARKPAPRKRPAKAPVRARTRSRRPR